MRHNKGQTVRTEVIYIYWCKNKEGKGTLENGHVKVNYDSFGPLSCTNVIKWTSVEKPEYKNTVGYEPFKTKLQSMMPVRQGCSALVLEGWCSAQLERFPTPTHTLNLAINR